MGEISIVLLVGLYILVLLFFWIMVYYAVSPVTTKRKAVAIFSSALVWPLSLTVIAITLLITGMRAILEYWNDLD